MAYYGEAVKPGFESHYVFKKRTLNSYWCVTPAAWNAIMQRYAGCSYVYACGKDPNIYSCARCGNCLREYFACAEKIAQSKKDKDEYEARVASGQEGRNGS